MFLKLNEFRKDVEPTPVIINADYVINVIAKEGTEAQSIVVMRGGRRVETVEVTESPDEIFTMMKPPQPNLEVKS